MFYIWNNSSISIIHRYFLGSCFCIRRTFWKQPHTSEHRIIVILILYKSHITRDNPYFVFLFWNIIWIAFVDFDNGTAQFSYKHLLDSANARFNALANEVAGLREFKRETESAARNAKIEEVFSKFVDLCEDQRFIDLKNNCDDMSVEDIEDKCFAIRGRNAQVKFSQNTPAIRLPVEGRKPDTADTNEPYNGVFVEFGFDKK